MHGFVVHEFGGPDVMLWEELPKLEPGPGQVLVDALMRVHDIFEHEAVQSEQVTDLSKRLGVTKSDDVDPCHRPRVEEVRETLRRNVIALFEAVGPISEDVQHGRLCVPVDDEGAWSRTGIRPQLHGERRSA